MRTYLFLLFTLLSLSVFGQYGDLEDAPSLSNGFYDYGMNKVSHISFDYSGRVIGKGKSYFNSLGKATQSLNWDPITRMVWGQQVLYDQHGRGVFSTLSAPIETSLSYGYVPNFILDTNNSAYTYLDFDQSGNIDSPSMVSLSSYLGTFYSNSNSSDPYQDVTSYPFSRTIYSHLNPGNVLKVLGGNKINGEWKQSYSFKMPAGTELNASWAFGSSYDSSTRVVKTVMRDVHGIETVVFTDGDGNTLAAARSGNEQGTNTNSYTNTLSIHKEQGYVDIHIPNGVNGFNINNPNSSASGSLKVYNLITENQEYGSTSSLGSGFYRVAVSTPRAYSESTSSAITVSHQVNYYDYSLNSYDIAGRLISSKQPLNQLESTYQYNTLGELLSTTSPDEGSAGFIYRRDGQIRFSQNAKQAAAGEFSYTNYDGNARPIESGVCQESGPYMFFNQLSGTSNIHNGVTREEIHTLYDMPDPDLSSYLSSVGLIPSDYPQTFVAGNVSKTWTAEPATNTTWYSYDVLGRVKWIIQKVEGLDKAQIIKYSYAPETGQVSTIDYNPHISSDRFVHRYNYNVGGQLVKVETSTDGSSFQTQADYIYNDGGTLTRTVLAEDLQGIDYVYNLNGQLKAINHPSLNPFNDPGQDGNGNGVAADVFGMSLDYYDGDYSRSNTPTPVAQHNTTGADQYNGNIKGVRYRTEGFNGSGDFQSYMFSYNKNNWLAGATYGSGSISPVSGNQHQVNFTGDANNDYQVSNLTYDANGNLQSLKRNGYTDGNGTNAMDDFTYHYNNGNQLQYVEDTGDNSDSQRYNDLKDQSSNGNPNYVYNTIGQLVTDVQEGITYTYTASGLVSEIYGFSPSNQGDWTPLLEEDFSNATTTETANWAVTDGTAGLNDNGDYSVFNNDPSACYTLSNTYGASVKFQSTYLFLNQTPPDPITVSRSLSVSNGNLHRLSFDMIIKQTSNMLHGSGQTPSANQAVGYTYEVLADDGVTVLASGGFNSPNPSIQNDPDMTSNDPFGYCGVFYDESEEVSFTPNSNTVTLKITYDYSLTGGQIISYLDNLLLEVAQSTDPVLKFTYNDRGQRIKKEYNNNGTPFYTYYVRDVSGNVMGIYGTQNYNGSYQTPLQETPFYGASRLGVLDRISSLGYSQEIYQYQLTDHLGNVRGVIRKDNNTIYALTAKTDYYPFGMPMPNKHVQGDYRYAYQGQEKDPETGMEAFELRLWDGRIGRWLNPDPYGQYSSPYLGMGNNPINGVDPDGGCFDDDGNPCVGQEGDVVTGYGGNEWKNIGGDNWEIVDGTGMDPTAWTNTNSSNYLAYVNVKGGFNHSFLLDPDTGNYWEASHPRNDSGEVEHGLFSWIKGNEKSVIRSRNINDGDFWTFAANGEERGDIEIYFVKIPDKNKAIEFANQSVGEYDYNFGAKNCKHFVIKAMNAGHANVPNSSALPGKFTKPNQEFWATTPPDLEISNPN